MPVIPTSFNRFLRLFLLLSALQLPLIEVAQSQLPALSEQQLLWIGDRVYQNECGSRFDCLTSWNQGEDFPSLGIGHFIWFRADQKEAFVETFPALLAYYQARGVRLPDWIEALSSLDSPWQTRSQFMAESQGAEMQELRQFLARTTTVQVDFIVQRLRDSIPAILSDLTAEQGKLVENQFYTLTQSQPPYGIYALIDYVHFKGSGTDPGERYQDHGWGLLQVLQQMQDSPSTLDSFVGAAATVLERRVANAPIARGEQRWLVGWKNRLRGYLPVESNLLPEANPFTLQP